MPTQVSGQPAVAGLHRTATHGRAAVTGHRCVCQGPGRHGWGYRSSTAPVLALAYQSGARMRFDEQTQQFVPVTLPAGMFVCGRANGIHTLGLKLADGAEVRLENEGADQLLVTSGRSRFHLACLSPDSFPDLKSGSFTHTFQIAAARHFQQAELAQLNARYAAEADQRRLPGRRRPLHLPVQPLAAGRDQPRQAGHSVQVADQYLRYARADERLRQILQMQT